MTTDDDDDDDCDDEEDKEDEDIRWDRAAVLKRGLETLALTPVIIIMPICYTVHINPLRQPTSAKNSLIF